MTDDEYENEAALLQQAQFFDYLCELPSLTTEALAGQTVIMRIVKPSFGEILCFTLDEAIDVVERFPMVKFNVTQW